MSSSSTILCSVIPMPLHSTGQLGWAHFAAAQEASVLPSAYSAHSGAVTICSRGRQRERGGGRELGNRLLWMHSVKGLHYIISQLFIKQHVHIENAFSFKRFMLILAHLTSLFSVFQGHLFCCILEIQRDVQWAVCAQQWNSAHVLCWCCR